MPVQRDDYENFRIERNGGSVRLTIDSTSKMNAFHRRMSEELFLLATRLGEDESIRCVVLTGSGGVFSVGADTEAFDADEPVTEIKHTMALFHDALIQFHKTGTPLLVGVNGAAVGGGMGLAISGDLVLVRDDAYFKYGYPNVGLTSDGASSFHLPRLVGLRNAQRIALLDERIEAQEAVELGLATERTSTDDFDDRLEELGQRLANGPTKALERITRLLRRSFHRPLERQLAEEMDSIARAMRTDDHAEAVRAFADNRRPDFAGR